MRIAVFGSTGKVGRLLVALALVEGHDVTAFARDPRKLADINGARLTVVQGDLSDREAVGRAVAGADAVVNVMGPGARPAGTRLSDGVRTIADEMQRAGVRRLVSLATASVPDPEDRFDLRSTLLVWAIRLIFRGAYDEIRRIGDIVRASDTDWTLVRIGLLDDAAPKPVRVGHYGRGEVGLYVSRKSLARFMLDRATAGDFVREAPAISN